MKKLFIAVINLMAVVYCPAREIIIDANGTGEYATIQAAINAAVNGDEIVLQVGRYKSDGNRDVNFCGKAITVRSSTPSDSNIVAATIIDCNGTYYNRHRGFVFQSGENNQSRLSGVTITNGYGSAATLDFYDDGRYAMDYIIGGGILCNGASPTITNCVLVNNSAKGTPPSYYYDPYVGYYGIGGGIFCYNNSSPVILNCIISQNTDSGIYWVTGKHIVTGCEVTHNNGPGIVILKSEEGKIQDCEVSGNNEHGLMINDANSEIIDAVFENNTRGGIRGYNSYLKIRGCFVTGNQAPYYGAGGIELMLERNFREYPPDCINIVENCVVSGNTDGGISCDGNTIITGCTVENNHNSGQGGGIRCYGRNITISNCIIRNNTIDGVKICPNCDPWVASIDCLMCTEIYSCSGGGVYCALNSGVSIKNCFLYNNIVKGDSYTEEPVTWPPPWPWPEPVRVPACGGGIFSYTENTVVENCSLLFNEARGETGYESLSYGGGIFGLGTAKNTILYGNKAYNGSAVSVAKVSGHDANTFSCSYSWVPRNAGAIYTSQGCGFVDGGGNFSGDAGISDDGHLKLGSACINAGEPNYTAMEGEKDFDGEERIFGGRLDIGADEFTDSDGDGLPDWWELKYFGDKLSANPFDDTDSDGLNNLTEYKWGTNPLEAILTYYVDNNDGDNSLDGLTPDREDGHGPKKTIQAGIDAAMSGDTVVIMAGTYRGTGNRDLDFMGKVITVRSTEPNDASVVAATIIDCQGSSSSKHYGFYFHSGEERESKVSGLTVINAYGPVLGWGWEYGYTPIITNIGGAFFCDGSNPTIEHCNIPNIQNNSYGIFCLNSGTFVNQCTIQRSAYGTVAFIGGSPEIAKSVITDNNNGAISCYDSNVTLRDCTIEKNCKQGHGDVVYLGDSNSTIIGCIIRDNYKKAGYNIYGGRGIYCEEGKLKLTDSTISGHVNNYSSGMIRDGGGMGCYSATVDMNNCTVSGNKTDNRYGGGVYFERCDANLVNCTIADNNSNYNGGGIYCKYGNLAINGCRINENEGYSLRPGLGQGGGGIYIIDCCDITIGKSIISRNTAPIGCGGIYISGGRYEIFDCIISGNISERSNDATAGGIDCSGKSGSRIYNCAITKNVGYIVGGIACSGNGLSIENCTIMDNFSMGQYEEDYTGGILCPAGTVMKNCIIWGNSLGQILGSPVVTYCDIQGGRAGAGNIDKDPLFAGDYHLQANSPCIDAGDSNVPEEVNEQDIDGEQRIYGAKIDMGADEVIDRDKDGLPDWWEKKYFGSAEDGEANGNPDGDEWDNIKEYVYGSRPVEPSDYYVHGSDGNDAWDGLAAIWDGQHGPKKTIQAGLDACPAGQVIIAEGTYKGAGNRDLTMRGKTIVARSVNPEDQNVTASTIIDCNGEGSGYYIGFVFESGESIKCEVAGLTIRYGNAIYDEMDYGGGIYGNGASGTIRNCVITSNYANQRGGGIGWYSGNVDINGCIVKNNICYLAGGGIYCDSEANNSISNCLIENNKSNQFCGGLMGARRVENCLILNNIATVDGGGGWCYQSKIVNCTIMGNSAASGGGLYISGGGEIVNSIIWDNNAPTGRQIASSQGTLIISYSDIEGGTSGVSGGVNWGAGNKNTDPVFMLEGNYHLSSVSPCVDAGTNNPAGGLSEKDLAGNARCADGDKDGMATTDMGTYELTRTAGPYLSIVPNTFAFKGYINGPETDVQVLTLQNIGTGSIGWQIFEDCDWLEISCGSGEVGSETNEVVLRIDLTGLSRGTYTYNLKVYDPNNGAYLGAIPVKMDLGLTLHVPGEYPTIQAGIDAGQSGDLVYVADGIYRGNGNRDINFKCKKLLVKSEKGPKECIIDCEKGGRGFAFYCSESEESIIDGFTIMNGYGQMGGGIYCPKESRPTIKNCILKGNKSERNGGAILAENRGAVYDQLISNCIIAGNKADGSGGGLSSSRINMILKNCTITGNSAKSGCGGVNGSARMNNCIVWNNSGLAVAGDIQAVYSNIEGEWPGNGNIDCDPCFVNNGYWDANGTTEDVNDDFWVDGDYHLKSEGWRLDSNTNEWTWDEATSRCIDSGNPATVLRSEPMTLAVDPLNRWGRNTRIDMGVYGGTAEASMGPPEWSILSDLNNDGKTNGGDLSVLAEMWLQKGEELCGDLDKDGDVDMRDFAMFGRDWMKETVWR